MKLNATRELSTFSILGALIVLAACGGGYGGSGDGYGGGDPPPLQTFSVGGTVAGLADEVVLSNGSNEVSVDTNGAFHFSTEIRSGTAFAITVKTHPSFPAQDCTVANGSGVIGSGDITNVVVTCTDLPVPVAQVEAGVSSATLTWTTPAEAESFKVHISLDRNCDITNDTTGCDKMTLLSATSPFTFTGLPNGQAHFFHVEAVYENGAHGLAAEVGARPNTLAFNGTVSTIAPAAEGVPPADGSVVYLGGDFTQVGITTGSGVPIDAATGQLASPDFPMVDGTVRAVVADGAGGWYIGGSFISVGGTPKNNVAHLLADGSVDPHWDASIDGVVFALGVLGNTVYVGGDFDAAGSGVERHGLAAFDASTGVLKEDWNPNTHESVLALAVRENTLYAGGIVEIGHLVHARLAAIDTTTGVPVPTWAPEFEGPSAIVAVALSRDGNTVYAGGIFTNVGGADRNYLAAFLAPHAGGTGLPTAWNPNADDEVHALAVSGNTVYVGGDFEIFTDADGRQTQRNGLAALNATTAEVMEEWRPQLIRDPLASIAPVTTIAVTTDGTVHVGGSLTGIGKQTRRHLAAIDANGALTGWNPNANADVFALALSPGRVYAGGRFSSVGSSVTRNHLAALDANGVLTAWNPGANRRVIALAVSPAGTVYAGGFFRSVGDGIERHHLAAFDASGAVMDWDPNLDDWVSDLVVTGSTIYAAGRFLNVGKAPSRGLAAIDATSAKLITGWQDPRIIGGAHALVVHRGTVYAAGGSVAVQGDDRFHLFAFDAQSGELNRGWDPGLDNFAAALAVADDTIYVSGSFDAVNVDNEADIPNSIRRNRLAAFPALDEHGAGSAKALPWNPNVTSTLFGAQMRALAVHGSAVYVGGEFDGVNSDTVLRPRRNLAAFETVGEDKQGQGKATPWNPSATWDRNSVLGIITFAVSGSHMYLGGEFSGLNGNVVGGFGVLDLETGQASP